MIKIKLILQGWKNLVLDLFSDIKYRNEFNERIKICKECTNNLWGMCIICNCILSAKTRAEDAECPIGKWKDIDHIINEKERK